MTSSGRALGAATAGPSALPAPVPPVVVGAAPLSVSDVMAVARHGAPVLLAVGVVPALERARAVVDRLAAGPRAIYGLTTGLGAAVDTRLAPDDVAAFQRRALAARAVDVGERLPPAEVRATLFVRLAGLAAGASGISPAIAEAVAALLNRGVLPVAHGTGSIGEADLAVLAGLFCPLVGEGEAEWAGAVLPAGEAMRRAGIALPPLGPKDGIALINANSFSVATAALASDEAGRAARALTVAAALSLEAFRANLSVLDPRAVALRPAPGQAALSRRLLALLAGSDLHEPGAARRVQDPLSLRGVAPVHGALHWRLDELEAVIVGELNGAGDSPAVLVEAGPPPEADGPPGAGDMISTVNFDTTALALSAGAGSAALAAAGALAAARVTRLLSGDLTGLPRFLARAGGSRAGFATLGKTAAALEAEIRHAAQPVGALSLPVADGVEDYAPQTPLAIRKLREAADRLATLAALELVVAAEAADQRGHLRLGGGTRAAHGLVRDLVAPLDDDRPTGVDVRRVAEAVRAGAFEAAWGGADA